MIPVIVALSLSVFLPVSGEATIRAKAGPSEIVVTTTSRLAGGIHSLTWNGKEFIDSTDHGRQLQSACAFDCGKTPFWAEAYNPTESGSRKDHVGPTSSSRLLRLATTANGVETRTRMAFWLNPGEKSDKYPALNTKPVSDHVLTKRVTIGRPDLPHAIDYRVTFTVPNGEFHTLAQFEALTGYMPPEFGTFETFDPKAGDLAPLDDGPGEQKLPVVFSTKTGSHAMGVLAHDSPPALTGPGYGRWRFQSEKVVKWNAVFRLRDAKGVPAGDYAFRLIVAVGTREDVRATLAKVANAEK